MPDSPVSKTPGARRGKHPGRPPRAPKLRRGSGRGARPPKPVAAAPAETTTPEASGVESSAAPPPAAAAPAPVPASGTAPGTAPEQPTRAPADAADTRGKDAAPHPGANPQRGSAPRKPPGRGPRPPDGAHRQSAPPPAGTAAKAPAGSGKRRSFSQENLALKTEGPDGAWLGQALEVPEESGYALTHAFHPYPGRFHPLLPRTVLARLSTGRRAAERPRVLDPFMGGGTTLVEGMLLGLPTLGSDLNPISQLVARERTRPRSAAEAGDLRQQLRRIANTVESLRGDRHAPRHVLKTPQRILPLYQSHLLAELMQWMRLITALPDGEQKETLRAVFSAGAVKFSNLTADSREDEAPPRYPKGAVTRFLVDKGEELLRAQQALAARLPPQTPRPLLLCEDARLLPSLSWDTAEVVLTSPPYPGTYDYFRQHRLRMDWLELEGEDFEVGEIGAKREAVEERWSTALKEVFGTLARVLKPGGGLYLVMGDWIEGSHGVDAARALRKLAATEGWTLQSSASVQRGVHSRTEKRAFDKLGKWEHLLHFTHSRG